MSRRATAQQILYKGNGGEPQELDPHVVTGVSEYHIIMSLFEGLVSEDPHDLHPVPGVAESWDVSPDGKIYTFHLRKNAKWSNGDPVTARDFLESYKRILTPSLASEYSYMHFVVKNAQAYNEGKITDFDQVGYKVLDDYTLQVTLENSTPYFLVAAASSLMVSGAFADDSRNMAIRMCAAANGRAPGDSSAMGRSSWQNGGSTTLSS